MNTQSILRIVTCLLSISTLLNVTAFAVPWKLDYKPGEKIPLPQAEFKTETGRPVMGTFFSASPQRAHYPPLPCYPMFLRDAGYDVVVHVLDAKNRTYLVDDRLVDYDAIYKERETKQQEELALHTLELSLGLISAEEFSMLEGGGGPMEGASFGPDDLWLEITQNTNVNFVNLTLHNTRSNLFYQIHSTVELHDTLNPVASDWIPGEIFTNAIGLTDILFAPVSVTHSPQKFFRAVASDTLVSIVPIQQSFEPSTTNFIGGDLGLFKISRANINGDISQPLDIPINISGTASNGVDYLDLLTFPLIALTNVQTIDANQLVMFVELDPQEDDVIELDETIVLRIAVTNSYVIDPANFQATITLSDPPEKLFVPVATFDGVPVGIDYHSPSNSLLVSLVQSSTFNFVRVDTNGFKTNWSGIQNINDEIKIAVSQSTASGFTNGSMYFGNGADVGIVSPNGAISNMLWVTLTNSFGTNETLLRGSLHVDQSGSFGGNLLVVSGGNTADQGGGVWSVSATGGITAIATIPDTHLEGLISLTNDPAKWGPWAGKILAGAESAIPPAIFAISTNGIVLTNHLDIQPEDFDVIVANQNLYCLDQQQSRLLKLSSNLFTNFVGDLLVTQEGALDHLAALVPNNHHPKLIMLHWDGTNFVQRASISRRSTDWLEHSTFAPMNIPQLP